jgi:hypothetical protein
MRACGWLTLLAGVLVAGGCGDGEKLFDVSGTVTFDNKPVPKGMVYFDPDPTAGGSGPQGFAPLEDGVFDTAKGGKGIRGGGYVIRVAGHNGKVANENPWGAPLFNEYEFKRVLPKENSTLTIDVPKKR